MDAERAAAPEGGGVTRVGGAGVECALGSDVERTEKRMTGGAQNSVGKMEAQFTQPTGVDVHIWVSKI